MPNYQFNCKCGHTEDVMVPIDDRDLVLVKCGKCNTTMQRDKLNSVFLLGFDKNGSSR